MGYYLSLNGTSDYLKLPSLTYNKIVIDALLYTEPSDGVLHYAVDSVSRSTGGYLRYNNGTQFTNFTIISPPITKGTRATNTLTIATATGGLSFGSAYSTGNYFKMDIYSITVYNGAAVVALYDMSTGTVSDQSGNGNNATLVGGTWVQDTPSGSITSVAAASTTTAIAPSVSVQKQATITGVAATSTASAPAPSISIVQPNVTISVLVASSSAAANAPSVGTGSNVSVAATVANVASSAVVPTFSTAAIAAITATVAAISNAAIAPTVTTIRNVNVVQVTATATITASSPKITLNANQIIGSVVLKASRTLTVPLIASRQLIVDLKGGLPVAEVNQNFNMYAGESKTIPVTATNTEDGTPIALDGVSSIKWGMRKIHGASNDVDKDSASGITVTDAINGKFTINLDANDTRTLSGDFIHEARVVDSLGKESLVMKGIINIEGTIV